MSIIKSRNIYIGGLKEYKYYYHFVFNDNYFTRHCRTIGQVHSEMMSLLTSVGYTLGQRGFQFSRPIDRMYDSTGTLMGWSIKLKDVEELRRFEATGIIEYKLNGVEVHRFWMLDVGNFDEWE